MNFKVILRIAVPRSYHFDFTFQSTDFLPIHGFIMRFHDSLFTGFFTGFFWHIFSKISSQVISQVYSQVLKVNFLPILITCFFICFFTGLKIHRFFHRF